MNPPLSPTRTASPRNAKKLRLADSQRPASSCSASLPASDSRRRRARSSGLGSRSARRFSSPTSSRFAGATVARSSQGSDSPEPASRAQCLRLTGIPAIGREGFEPSTLGLREARAYSRARLAPARLGADSDSRGPLRSSGYFSLAQCRIRVSCVSGLACCRESEAGPGDRRRRRRR